MKKIDLVLRLLVFVFFSSVVFAMDKKKISLEFYEDADGNLGLVPDVLGNIQKKFGKKYFLMKFSSFVAYCDDPHRYKYYYQVQENKNSQLTEIEFEYNKKTGNITLLDE